MPHLRSSAMNVRPTPLKGAGTTRANDVRGRAGGLLLAVTLGALLAGCSTLRPTQQAFAPDEYTLRHPIKIAEAPEHIDIFPNGPRLDRRQWRDVEEFARGHAQHGRSPISAAVPNVPGAARLLGDIQAALRAGNGSRLLVSRYASDARLGAAPIRLSFMRLRANVVNVCGLWPTDLAGSRDLETWHNRPYHNLGCAYQTMIAAQVADPIDLVRPRAEGPIDVFKRSKDIEALRKDQDPSTNWRKDDAKIKDAQQ